MYPASQRVCLAPRHALVLSADGAVGSIEGHLPEHSRALRRALVNASDRAWQAVAAAPAGAGWPHSMGASFTSGDGQGIREEVRLLPEGSPRFGRGRPRVGFRVPG